MILSPLQLRHSHFTALSLICREGASPDTLYSEDSPYPKVSSKDIRIEITLGTPDDDKDPKQFLITLGIATKEASELPYRFALQMEGFFEIEDDGDLEGRKRMVVINGGSMLFGIAREQILTLTQRHKYGGLLLPSLDFRRLSTSPVAAKKETKSPASRKTGVQKSPTSSQKKTRSAKAP